MILTKQGEIQIEARGLGEAQLDFCESEGHDLFARQRNAIVPPRVHPRKGTPDRTPGSPQAPRNLNRHGT